MDVRSRAKNQAGKAKAYAGKKKKLHKSDSESYVDDIEENKRRKQRPSSSKKRSNGTGGIFTQTFFLGMLAFISVAILESTYTFEVFVSLTNSEEFFKSFETIPNFASSSIFKHRISQDKIKEEEDIESEEFYVHSLENQNYLGQVSLPWENSFIKYLQAKFLTEEETHSETQDMLLEKAETWLRNKMMEWLENGDLDFDKLARREISEIKKKGLGQEALSSDVRAILQGTKVLEAHRSKYNDLIKKQSLIEAQIKEVVKQNSSALRTVEVVKPVELIIPAEISSIMN